MCREARKQRERVPGAPGAYLGKTSGVKLLCADPVEHPFSVFVTIKLPQEQGRTQSSCLRSFCCQSDKETLGRLLSASVDFHLPPARNNPCAKVARSGFLCLLFKAELAVQDGSRAQPGSR